MDIEKAEYIINYFSHLLNREEQIAIKHTNSCIIRGDDFDKPQIRNIYLKHGWITEDQEILQLLLNGYDNFQIQAAKRILEQNPDKVFLNNCPECGKLARTPLAKQCRFCGHNWHYQVIGKFRLHFSTKITNRGLFLKGEIVEGELSINDSFIDLGFAGINKKVEIKNIESVRKIENNKPINLVGLQINELNEDEIQTIINFGSTLHPINIFKNPSI
ncbi:hypothetical protein [Epilithonimonas mollis]|uniref:Uncharacterized protein n=1 Tax=Epilithonimonas mollis TaxID=216903 RepID=A0A1M6SG65_9FLAO|nr:hypothetical protein [Epilithonimonas mollis]SHK43660.1 hypothetical protein SAMN05444371_2444 [Epilithonimonas mollis]